MKRRRVLAMASLGVAALAGCQTNTGSGSGQSPSETATIQTITTENLSECTSGYSVSVDRFAPAEELPIVFRDLDSPRSIVTEAIQSGSATVELFGGPPIRAGGIVRHEDAFYRVEYSTVETESVPAQRVTLVWEAGQTAPDDGYTLQYEDLPEGDQVALRMLTQGPKYNERGHPQEGIRATETHAPFPGGTEDSRLGEEKTVWVEWNNRTYEVQVVGPAPDMERSTYRYEVSEIAGSPEDFREFVTAQYVKALDDLSPALHGLLERAIKEGYRECDPPSAPLKELRTQLEDFPMLPHPYEESSYVDYRGQRYRIQVSSWVV